MTGVRAASIGILALVAACSPTTPERPAPAIQADAVRFRYPDDRLPALVLPSGERRIVRSVLNIPKAMSFGDYIWNDTGIPTGPAWVRVDLGRQTMSVFRAGHEIGSAVILFGTDGKPTPAGTFPILAKAEVHRSTLYDAPMPYMLRLTGDGVAIHASNVRRGSATHGCIGVPYGFAALLFAQMRQGDQVVIVPAGKQERLS